MQDFKTLKHYPYAPLLTMLHFL